MLTITHQVARLTAPAGRLLAEGVGVHQTALYDMFFATCLFLVLYALSRAPRRLGVLTLVFGAVYGATRVLEDFLRVDKRVFGLTGSQWTGLTVSIVCIVTLIAWAVGARPSPDGPDDARRERRGSRPIADRSLTALSVGVAVMVARRHGSAGSSHERERLADLRSGRVRELPRRAPEGLARG